MMGAMRDKKFMKIILWALVGAFVGFIFLAWGMQLTGLGAPKDRNAVARVGKQVITYDEFYQFYRPAMDRMFGSGEEPSEKATQQLQKRVLDSLIKDAIILQTAKKLGIGVSTDEVAEIIRRERYFLDENGRFDKNRYLQVLQQNNMTPEQYEQSQYKDQLLQKVQVLLTGSVLYEPSELRAYADLLNRDLKVRYVSLDSKKFAEAVTFTERDLQDFYESHRDRYDKNERAKASHILITVREGSTPQEDEVAKKTLDEYRTKILSGKVKFEDLAKQYSQDEGSKKNGGSLGWFGRGMMDADFEGAVFSLKKGGLSKPIKTRFGYHLIRLDDYEPAYQSTFSAAKTKVTSDYRKDKGDQKLMDLVGDLTSRLEAGETLAKAAADLKLPSETTPWFQRKKDIPGIPKSERQASVLSETHLNEWKGPLYADNKPYFFQVVEERENKMTDKDFKLEEKELSDRLMSSKKSLWLDQFIENEKKKLDVKIMLADKMDSAPETKK